MGLAANTLVYTSLLGSPGAPVGISLPLGRILSNEAKQNTKQGKLSRIQLSPLTWQEVEAQKMGLRLLKFTGMEGHTHAHTHTHTHIHTHAHTHTHTHTHTRAHIHIHTCTYTYTHAQSRAGIPPKSQPSTISRGVRELLSTYSVPVSGLGVSPSHQDFIKHQLYAPPYQEEETTSKEKLL